MVAARIAVAVNARSGRLLLAVAVALAVLSGCTWAGNQPDNPERKPFTVGVTEKFNRLDPAAAGTGMSDAMVLAGFQRLLALDPDDGLLKPDAAWCAFDDAQTYDCELEDDLFFVDGAAVTAAAVKFSLDRAIALNSRGQAAVFFGSLDEIEVLDPDRIRFHLNRPDNEFGYALATPLSSLVSPNAYPPDRIRPASQLAVGSGPYAMQIITENRVGFVSYTDYVGFAGPRQERLNIQRYDSSEFLRNAMSNAEVDVTWNGLDSQQTAALDIQIEASPLSLTRDGFRRLSDPGGRAWLLRWEPESRWFTDAEVRSRVADAVARLRTDRSLVPPSVPGSAPVFDDTTTITAGEPLRLVIGFDGSVADEGLRAERLRTALGGAGIDAVVQPDAVSSDLRLTSDHPPIGSSEGWLLPWLAHPLPNTAERNDALVAEHAAAADAAGKARALVALQEQAAADQTVLPLWREDHITWMGPGISSTGRAYLGPGGQLAVWGFRR